MICEYYSDFKKTLQYDYINLKTVRLFDAYLQDKNVLLKDAWEEVEDFTELLPVTRKTMHNYRTRLKRYIEYIYTVEGITNYEKNLIRMNKKGEARVKES